ncbi:trimeric intracellular cation channel family protein [Tessaracoccus flavescens]|uniref:Glycine transporter domain-containing protein n=1 Tax=Tessaracoccus flavescens TaxID=399497 RepID=A0A1Q2CZM0_9ACTN|nr:TRIC cation channel family protein [Tessaracoccus flavescens]AQP51573.1 hypothetical protein BW733_12870 [Tessaracoccus flavescens]
MSESALLGFLQWIDLIGVVFNAVLGAVIGRAARLDVVGLAVLAIMSGLGGGMIRDVLLQSGPPIAITDWRYITATLAGAAVVMVVRVEGRWWDRIYPPIDALALGTWAAAGSLKTLEAGFGVLPALMLGTITAVGGGFVRDIVLRRIPGVLGGNTLYATAALAASIVAVGFWHVDLTAIGSVVATVFGAALVLLAKWRRLSLPVGEDAITIGEAVARGLAKSRRRTVRPKADDEEAA